jgi:pimeloyl-ACP methyl ester carboxylesterase
VRTCLLVLWGILSASLAVSAQTADPAGAYLMRERTSSGGETLKHLIYTPDTLAEGRRYPLVLYLHGSCATCVTYGFMMREPALRFLREEQREPSFIVAPIGASGGWAGPARRQAVFEILDGLLKEFPIDRRRIYVMGFSMGGTGTWSYLQARPGFFAAANPQAIGGGRVDAEVVKHTPIWTMIGTDDNASRIEELTGNVARIRAANGDPRGAVLEETGVNPRFTIFPSANHMGVQVPPALPELMDWLYAQVNDGNAAPKVRFIRPLQLDGAYATSINALVSAVDPDGSIDRVEFFLGDRPVSVDREAPYEHAFAGLASGSHTLRAQAFDNGGKSRVTAVSITVR